MPTIRPVSALRSFGSVLRECRDGEPVYLTRNGHGRYVILDIHDYEQLLGGRKVLVESGNVIEEIEEICVIEE